MLTLCPAIEIVVDSYGIDFLYFFPLFNIFFCFITGILWWFRRFGGWEDDYGDEPSWLLQGIEVGLEIAPQKQGI